MASLTPAAELSRNFENALLDVDRVRAHEIAYSPAFPGTPMERVEAIVIPALERLGTAWDEGALALSQIYMSGRICEELVERLLPATDSVRKQQPPMAIATLDDYHLLGKRMVYAVMRASGYALADLGRMEAQSLAQTCTDRGVEILLISTLMLPAALAVGELSNEFERLGYRPHIIVGGAPFRLDPDLWREVGANATGRRASDAVELVEAVRGGFQ